MEQRGQQLTEREPDLRGWAELDAKFGEEGTFDAEISAGTNGVSGRWRGAIPGIVFMASVAVMTLSQVPYAYLTIPILTLASVAAILWLQSNNGQVKNPSQSGGKPPREAANRAPPRSE